MRILIQEHPFDLGQEAQNFAEKQDNAGAIVTFTGIVRNTSLGDLKTLAIEHYPAMTEKAISEIAQTAIDRWSLRVDNAFENRDDQKLGLEPIWDTIWEAFWHTDLGKFARQCVSNVWC